MYFYIGPYLLVQQASGSIDWNCTHPAFDALENDFWLPVIEEMDLSDEEETGTDLYLLQIPSCNGATVLIVLPNNKVPGISRRLLVPDASLFSVDKYYNKREEILLFSERYSRQIKTMMSVLESHLVQITWGNIGIAEPIWGSFKGGNAKFH